MGIDYCTTIADLAIYLSAELLKKLNHWHVTKKFLSKLDKDILDNILGFHANTYSSLSGISKNMLDTVLGSSENGTVIR